MNALEYIKSQIETWGEDYVHDLLEQNYTPILTDRGWKWIHPSNIKVTANS